MAGNAVAYAKRLIRAVQGQDLWLPVQTECSTVSLGNDGAQWAVCLDGLSENSVVYSIGVGEDISFDLELIARCGMRIHAFDPTPRSIRWLELQQLPDKFIFHDYGVADYDGISAFFPPADPLHVSYSAISRPSRGPKIHAAVYRIATIMQTLGHDHIDLLKMDIEGSEYRVLENLMTSRMPVGQILVEFHHRWPEIGIQRTRNMIQDLNAAGYDIFSISPNGEEYGFRRSAIH